MRNQVAAIIVVFATLLIVEPILTGVLESRWPEIPKYFPIHLISGVIGDDPKRSREERAWRSFWRTCSCCPRSAAASSSSAT